MLVFLLGTQYHHRAIFLSPPPRRGPSLQKRTHGTLLAGQLERLRADFDRHHLPLYIYYFGSRRR